MKKGFTLIEMIFVIAVTGVIVGMTFVQVSQIYESLIQKNYSSEIQNEASIVSEQIVSRLSGAFKESLAMTNKLGGQCIGLADLNTSMADGVLMWVAKSDESEKGIWDDTAKSYIGWSGLVDKNESSNTFISPATNLEGAEEIIDSLTGETNSLSKTSNSPVALYFVGGNVQPCGDFFGGSGGKLHQIKRDGANKIVLLDANASQGRYAITHAAYAIERDNDKNLWLYRFRPWLSEKPSSDTNKILLARNVSKFGFKYDGAMFRINICLSKTLNGFEIEACKERAVF